MPSPQNPYRSSGSVGDSAAFVGRAELLGELSLALRRPERAAVIVGGGPGSGKTSLLDELRVQLSESGGLRAARFDPAPFAGAAVDDALVALAGQIAGALGVDAPARGAWPEDQLCGQWLPAALARLGEGERLVLLIDAFPVVDDARSRTTAGALLPLVGGLLERHAARLAVVVAYDLRSAGAEAALRKHLPSPLRRAVGPLELAQAWSLVRLSQVDRSLMWTNEAVDALLERSGCHPAVTQALCEVIWDKACSAPGRVAPTATAAMVHAAVAPALDALSGHFLAVWSGLPPAARLVLGVLAWSDRGACGAAELGDLLRARGLRGVGRELLEDGPRELRRQDVLDADPAVLRPTVPLLRTWVRAGLPLDDIFGELDGLLPQADERYRAAALRWQAARGPGVRREAADAVRAVLAVHPDHTGALEMLAAIHLRDGELAAAVPFLERLHPLRPGRAGPYLTRALLDLAAEAPDAERRLQLYNRVLEVAPEQSEAKRLRNRLLEDRGAAALAAGDLAAAHEAATASDQPTETSPVKQALRARHLEDERREQAAHEARSDYAGALHIARRHSVWSADIERLEHTARLANAYEEGVAALHRGERERARERFAYVVSVNPGFREVTRYLHLSVTGHDPAEARGGKVSPALFASSLALAAACALAWLLGVPAPGRGPAAIEGAPELELEALQASPAAAAAPPPATPMAPPAVDAPAATAPVELGAAAAAPAAPAPAAARPAAEPLGGPVGEDAVAAADPVPVPVLAVAAPPPAPAPIPAPPPGGKRTVGDLLRQGWADIEAHDLRGAREAFDAAVRERPANPDAWYGVGFVAELSDNKELALQSYCKARELGGKRPELLRDVNTRLRLLGQRCGG